MVWFIYRQLVMSTVNDVTASFDFSPTLLRDACVGEGCVDLYTASLILTCKVLLVGSE